MQDKYQYEVDRDLMRCDNDCIYYQRGGCPIQQRTLPSFIFGSGVQGHVLDDHRHYLTCFQQVELYQRLVDIGKEIKKNKEYNPLLQEKQEQEEE